MKQGSRRATVRVGLRTVVTWFAAVLLAASGAGDDGSCQDHVGQAERFVLSVDAAAARREYQKALAEAESPEERSEVWIALADLLSAADAGPTAAELRKAERLYRRALKELAALGVSEEARRLAAVARNNLAVLLLERGRAVKALALLEDPAPTQAPADLRAQLLHNRGLAAERLSRPVTALEDFLTALAGDPSHRPAVESVGRLVLGLSPERGPEIAAWAADQLVEIGELAAAEALLARAFDAWGASRPLVSSLTGYLASARVGPEEFQQRWHPKLEGDREPRIATLEAVYTGELDIDSEPESLPGSKAWRSETDRRRLAALLEVVGDHATRASELSTAAARYAVAWRLDSGRFNAFYCLARLIGRAAGELDPDGRRLDALAAELQRRREVGAVPRQSQEVADAFLMLGLAASDQGRPEAREAHLDLYRALRAPKSRVPPLPAGKKLRIAVSSFKDHSGKVESKFVTKATKSEGTDIAAKGDLGGQVADAIITELVKLGRYEVVERVELEDVISEQKLQLGDLNQLSNAARLLGADLLVTGSITQAASARNSRGYVVFSKKKLFGEVVLDTRLVDVNTTKALWGTTTEGLAIIKSKKILGIGIADVAGVQLLLGRAARQAADAIVDQLVPILEHFSGGRVAGPVFETAARLRGTQIYLAAGAKIGVQVGDKFDLFVSGKPFKVGEITIREKTLIGTVDISEVHSDYAVGPAPERLANMSRRQVGKLTALRHPVSSAQAARLLTEPPYRYVTTDGSRLRAGPGTNHEVLTGLSRYSRIEVIGAEGYWLKIRTIDGTEGWIHSELTSYDGM